MIVKEIDNDYPITGDSLVIPYAYGGSNYACYITLSKNGSTNVKASKNDIIIKQNNIDASGQGESNVQIINLRGQVVQSIKVVGNRQLSIDNLAPGVYQVRTQTAKGITCRKMVR